MDMSVKLGLSYPASAAPDVSTSKRQAHEQAASEPVDKESKPVAKAELESAVSAIQDFVKASERQLDFSIDDSTGQVVSRSLPVKVAKSSASCRPKWR